MNRAERRLDEAAAMIADAEALVAICEADLAAATSYLARDIALTELQEADRLADEVGEAVGPTIEERRREVAEAGWAAIRAARGDVGACWADAHRRWMAASTKSWLIQRLGRRGYEALPWALALVVLQGSNF